MTSTGATSDPTGADLVGRNEAARLLGFRSIGGVRALEAAGVLRSAGLGTNARGKPVHLFARADVLRVRDARDRGVDPRHAATAAPTPAVDYFRENARLLDEVSALSRRRRERRERASAELQREQDAADAAYELQRVFRAQERERVGRSESFATERGPAGGGVVELADEAVRAIERVVRAAQPIADLFTSLRSIGTKGDPPR